MERDCSAHKYVRVRSTLISTLSVCPPFPLLLARPPRARRNASVPPASAPDAIMLGIGILPALVLSCLFCAESETLALCFVSFF
jgi:hypothetical protein